MTFFTLLCSIKDMITSRMLGHSSEKCPILWPVNWFSGPITSALHSWLLPWLVTWYTLNIGHEGCVWWEGSDYKGIIHCETHRGEWNPDWTEPTRVVRQSRRWKPAQSVQLSREKCFLDSFEMICEAMKVTATAYGSGHGHFNCLSPRFPVFCWSMKKKTTRLLWQECGTNQCQKRWRSNPRCLDLDVWIVCESLFFYHLLIFPCTWVFDCKCPKDVELNRV